MTTSQLLQANPSLEMETLSTSTDSNTDNSKSVKSNESTTSVTSIIDDSNPVISAQWETVEAGGDLVNRFKGIAGMSTTLYQNLDHGTSMLVLYGGTNGTITGHSLSNLFVLDTTKPEWKWEEKSLTGPNTKVPDLFWHTATLVGSNIYYIFGRSFFFRWNCSNTVFAISATELGNSSITWTQLKIEYPNGLIAPRYAHSACAIGKKIYVFGGTDGVWSFKDMSVLDTETMVWSKLREAPEFRSGHTATAYKHYVIITGGYDHTKPRGQKFVRTVLVYDTINNEWFHPLLGKNEFPRPRVGHTATLSRNKIYMFGGFSEGRHVLQDLWCLDVENLEKGEAQWKRVSTAGLINPRYGHQTVYLHGDSDNQHTFLVIGGGAEPSRSWSPSQFFMGMSMLRVVEPMTLEGASPIEPSGIPTPIEMLKESFIAPSSPSPSAEENLPAAHRISNQIRKRTVKPINWGELEWQLIALNVLLGTILYMLMPYILPLIWKFVSAMAFIGGLTFCIALTTAGFYAFRFWPQLKMFSLYGTQLYDIYMESEGSPTAIISEIVRGGLGPNANDESRKSNSLGS